MLSVSMAGLNAAQKSMDVVSNNIANANTVGFKSSTASFGDVFSNDPASDPKTAVGSGVLTSAVTRNTTAGSVTTTGRVTDLAIDGRGFFVVRDPSAQGDNFSFTQAGNFSLNSAGYLVDNSGNQLIGFNSVPSVDANGNAVLDAYGNPVMAPDVNSAKQAMQIVPQYTTGQTLPDGTVTGQEIQSMSFSGPATAAGNILISGTVGGQSVTATVPVAMGDTAATIAQNAQAALKTALNGQATVTITGSGDNSKVKLAFNVTDGAVSPFTVGLPPFSAPTSSISTQFSTTPQIQQIDFGTTNASASGTITVGGVSVAIATGDSPATVASKVQAALSASPAFSAMSVAIDSSTNKIDITYPANQPNVAALTIVDSSPATGVGASSTVDATYQSASTTPEVQSIGVESAAAADDHTINVAGVNVAVSAGDSAATIANKMITALNQVYPGRQAVYNPSTNSIALTFLASDGTVPLVQPKYSFKTPTSGTVAEIAKGGTDPVLMQSVSISQKGEIIGTYSNGSSYSMGFIALATFANDGGLKDIGGNLYAQSGASGSATISAAGAPQAGNIMTGELEQSNVDITGQLMTMIQAQQVYNGNARMIQTMMDTVSKITDLR